MPLKRSGFKAKGWAPRPAKQVDYEARPRAPAPRAQMTGEARVVPKFNHVRDTRLRDMCRAMACQHCGAAGPDAGVTWAHSNQSKHGKGRQLKASDQFVAAMCTACHSELDQGKRWTQEEKVRVWDDAHLRTVRLALQLGLWPAGVQLPDGITP